jgi:hypothetical protein
MLQVPKASGSCIPPPKPPTPHQLKGPGRPRTAQPWRGAGAGGAYRCYLIVTEQAGDNLQGGHLGAGGACIGVILQRRKYAAG